MTTEQIITFIDEIDCNKSSSGEIPAKIIKMAKEEVSEPITNCINDSIISGIFPGELKLADIVPSFKKEDLNDKANYRPISLLPLISKLYEKVLYQQIETLLIIFCPLNFVDSGRAIQHNMHFLTF